MKVLRRLHLIFQTASQILPHGKCPVKTPTKFDSCGFVSLRSCLERTEHPVVCLLTVITNIYRRSDISDSTYLKPSWKKLAISKLKFKLNAELLILYRRALNLPEGRFKLLNPSGNNLRISIMIPK